MIPFDITPQHPFSLILANTMIDNKDEDFIDNVWELQFQTGKQNGFSFYSSLGLHLSGLTFTPQIHAISETTSFRINNQPDLKISEFFPNYCKLKTEPYTNIKFQTEIFLHDSTSFLCQFQIVNESEEPFEGEINVSLNGKKPSGENLLNNQIFDSTTILTGKTDSLVLVFSLDGFGQTSKSGSSSLSQSITIQPGETTAIKGFLIFKSTFEDSMKKMKEFADFNFNKETTYNRLVYQGKLYFFETGNHEWDFALLSSQITAMQNIFATNTSSDRIYLSANRHPEKTILKQPKQGVDGIEGINPVQLWYLSRILPDENDPLEKVVTEWLETQTEDGFLPNHTSTASFNANYHSFPIVAGIVEHLLTEHTDKSTAQLFFSCLVKYLRYWMEKSTSHGIPCWQNHQQTLFEELPVHNYVSPRNHCFDPKFLKSPFLLSLLITEFDKTILISQRFNLEGADHVWLEETRSSLHAMLEETWSPADNTYIYRDIETNHPPEGKLLLAIKEAGLLKKEINLEKPNRLCIYYMNSQQVSKDNLIRIKGELNSQSISKSVSLKQFSWVGKKGSYTTKQVFDRINSVELMGVNQGDEIIISTLPAAELDSGCFTFITNQPNSKDHIESCVSHWVSNKLVSQNGLAKTALNEGINKNEEGFQYLNLPLCTLLLQGLNQHGYRALAGKFMKKMIDSVVKVLRKTKRFHKLYPIEKGSAAGEYNIIDGMLPVELFLNLLGVKNWRDEMIELENESVFNGEIKIYKKGIQLVCSPGGFKVINSAGSIKEIKPGKENLIKLSI